MDECGVCGGSWDSCALVLSLQSDSLAASSAPMSHPSQARSTSLQLPLWTCGPKALAELFDQGTKGPLLHPNPALQSSYLEVSTIVALDWE